MSNSVRVCFIAIILILYFIRHSSIERWVHSRIPVSEKPFFHRFPDAVDLPCASYFERKQRSLKSFFDKRVSVDLDELQFDVSCENVQRRHYFLKRPLSVEEAVFPLAFARNVYKDYLFIEAELATIYAPQNAYCYSIDSDADQKFKTRMHELSNCFDNVFITPEEFLLNSDGHDMDRAHLACLKILRNKPWKYVALLQNHDAVIKTNAELVQIYTWFNGANDVGTGEMTPNLYDTNLDWSFQALNLFKDASKNTNQNISFTKGFNQCSLSRAAVDYMFDELSLTKLVTNLNTDTYGIDEILVSTLNSNDAIGLPGGFTRKCLGSKANVNTLTRHQYWKSATRKCPSGKARHSICLIGVEYLSEIEQWPALFANKVYPEFDFGGYECMRERLFNRTFYPAFALPKAVFNKTTYLSQVAVRFHEDKKRSDFSIDEFQCTIPEKSVSSTVSSYYYVPMCIQLCFIKFNFPFLQLYL